VVGRRLHATGRPTSPIPCTPTVPAETEIDAVAGDERSTVTPSLVDGRTVETGAGPGEYFPALGPEPHPGVLVLHGGGGAGGYEREYAAMLAEHGYAALCADYFGRPGAPDALQGIPLERFDLAAEWLLDREEVAGDRVGVVGFSRGGEAALLVGAHFDTVGATVALVPSCYAYPAPSWMAGVEASVASWTLYDEPIAFVDIDRHVEPEDLDGTGDDPLAGATMAAKLAAERAPDRELERAAIPVADVDGPVLLVSGKQDSVWPSSDYAEQAATWLRDADHDWPVEHRRYPDAGHAIRVPYRFGDGDDPAARHRYGGTNAANARAAADAWAATLACLRRGFRMGEPPAGTSLE
jgi:dienelactone hydrolase